MASQPWLVKLRSVPGLQALVYITYGGFGHTWSHAQSCTTVTSTYISLGNKNMCHRFLLDFDFNKKTPYEMFSSKFILEWITWNNICFYISPLKSKVLFHIWAYRIRSYDLFRCETSHGSRSVSPFGLIFQLIWIVHKFIGIDSNITQMLHGTNGISTQPSTMNLPSRSCR